MLSTSSSTSTTPSRPPSTSSLLPNASPNDQGGSMKKVFAYGALAVALAIGAERVTAGTNPNTLTLAIYGDSPYFDQAFDPAPPWTVGPPPKLPGAEFNKTAAFINTINADPSVQEVIFVGDI